MDIPQISLSDLENHYVKSGSFDISDQDLKSLKKIKGQTQTAKFLGFGWVGAFILADITLNTKNFAKLKGFYKIGARLPYIGFHCVNAIAAYKVVGEFSQKYFNNYVDILAGYDKDVCIVKYYKNLIRTS